MEVELLGTGSCIELFKIMNYDAIVVGAGPAGAVLSCWLASHGLNVLILERQTLPRYKTCGDGVTLKALNSIPLTSASALSSWLWEGS